MIIAKRLSAIALATVLTAAPFLASANEGTSSEQGGLRGELHNIGSLFHGPAFLKRDDVASSSDKKHDDNTSTTEKDGKHQMKGGMNRIDARIQTLTELKARADASAHLSADQKASIDAAISGELTALANLKAGNGTTASSTLNLDLKNLLKSLKGTTQTLPKTAVDAAVDRTNTIVTEMRAFGDKLNTRITAAKNGGADVSVSETAYADYNAKLAAAKADADAAASLSATVVLNSTDSAVIAANHTALVNARAKIDDARTQLKAARKDVGVILKNLHVNASATASTTVEVK